ncbi:unnamed protein product [Amoebophrya sp. A120]|nr:unnamed protein product [Amoebophrya sp. A120]|eukprot:GSA120T00021775001.1
MPASQLMQLKEAAARGSRGQKTPHRGEGLSRGSPPASSSALLPGSTGSLSIVVQQTTRRHMEQDAEDAKMRLEEQRELELAKDFCSSILRKTPQDWGLQLEDVLSTASATSRPDDDEQNKDCDSLLDNLDAQQAEAQHALIREFCKAAFAPELGMTSRSTGSSFLEAAENGNDKALVSKNNGPRTAQIELIEDVDEEGDQDVVHDSSSKKPASSSISSSRAAAASARSSSGNLRKPSSTALWSAREVLEDHNKEPGTEVHTTQLLRPPFSLRTLDDWRISRSCTLDNTTTLNIPGVNCPPVHAAGARLLPGLGRAFLPRLCRECRWKAGLARFVKTNKLSFTCEPFLKKKQLYSAAFAALRESKAARNGVDLTCPEAAAAAGGHHVSLAPPPHQVVKKLQTCVSCGKVDYEQGLIANYYSAVQRPPAEAPVSGMQSAVPPIVGSPPGGATARPGRGLEPQAAFSGRQFIQPQQQLQAPPVLVPQYAGQLPPSGLMPSGGASISTSTSLKRPRARTTGQKFVGFVSTSSSSSARHNKPPVVLGVRQKNQATLTSKRSCSSASSSAVQVVPARPPDATTHVLQEEPNKYWYDASNRHIYQGFLRPSFLSRMAQLNGTVFIDYSRKINGKKTVARRGRGFGRRRQLPSRKKLPKFLHIYHRPEYRGICHGRYSFDPHSFVGILGVEDLQLLKTCVDPAHIVTTSDRPGQKTLVDDDAAASREKLAVLPKPSKHVSPFPMHKLKDQCEHMRYYTVLNEPGCRLRTPTLFQGRDCVTLQKEAKRKAELSGTTISGLRQKPTPGGRRPPPRIAVSADGEATVLPIKDDEDEITFTRTASMKPLETERTRPLPLPLQQLNHSLQHHDLERARIVQQKEEKMMDEGGAAQAQTLQPINLQPDPPLDRSAVQLKMHQLLDLNPEMTFFQISEHFRLHFHEYTVSSAGSSRLSASSSRASTAASRTSSRDEHLQAASRSGSCSSREKMEQKEKPLKNLPLAALQVLQECFNRTCVRCANQFTMPKRYIKKLKKRYFRLDEKLNKVGIQAVTEAEKDYNAAIKILFPNFTSNQKASVLKSKMLKEQALLAKGKGKKGGQNKAGKEEDSPAAGGATAASTAKPKVSKVGAAAPLGGGQKKPKALAGKAAGGVTNPKKKKKKRTLSWIVSGSEDDSDSGDEEWKPPGRRKKR